MPSGTVTEHLSEHLISEILSLKLNKVLIIIAVGHLTYPTLGLNQSPYFGVDLVPNICIYLFIYFPYFGLVNPHLFTSYHMTIPNWWGWWLQDMWSQPPQFFELLLMQCHTLGGKCCLPYLPIRELTDAWDGCMSSHLLPRENGKFCSVWHCCDSNSQSLERFSLAPIGSPAFVFSQILGEGLKKKKSIQVCLW